MPWKLHALLALSVFAVSGAVLVTMCAAQPAPELTKPALKAKVKEIQQIVFEDKLLKAIGELKALGPLPRLQEMLGELYADADAKEKVTILYILDRVGVENAIKALPVIAADFAVARPKHPNDMSFAGFYVLEKFMHLAWKKLPTDKEKRADEKKISVPKGQPEPKPQPPAEHKPNKVASDGFTHTGSPADRKAIRQFILDHGLNVAEKKNKAYPVPPAADTDWVRVIGNHAFVRLRGDTSGVDLLFIQSKHGEWCLLAHLSHWVN